MKTFRIGGVHPAENKLSAGKAIETLALPKQAVFPLSQHIGAPATAIVKKGDVVKVGTKIAEAGGFVSAAIFSSVSGKVNKVDSVIDASGYRKPAIFIDVEGDEWEETIDRSTTLVKECNLTPEEIVAKIKNAGVVGMGGACFPTHVKLTPPPGCKAECVIINAVECEPYLTADHRLMLEKADEILVGVSILMKAAKVTKGYIGIENNKPDAIKLMTEKAAAYPGIEVVPLKVKYPQGGEKQLIDAVIGRQVPAPPAIPINVGAVVQNVGTAYAVYEAVQKNKPLFERVVTVTGKSLKNPSNFLTRSALWQPRLPSGRGRPQHPHCAGKGTGAVGGSPAGVPGISSPQPRQERPGCRLPLECGAGAGRPHNGTAPGADGGRGQPGGSPGAAGTVGAPASNCMGGGAVRPNTGPVPQQNSPGRINNHLSLVSPGLANRLK